jgi:hypothetical protein
MKAIDISKIIFQPVTVTFLEMHEPKELPAPFPNINFGLLPKPIPQTNTENIITELEKNIFGWTEW